LAQSGHPDTLYECLLLGVKQTSVFAEAKAKDYTRDQWEAALDKAEQRAEPDEDELPLIIVDDLY